jgi:hypothetical protein
MSKKITLMNKAIVNNNNFTTEQLAKEIAFYWQENIGTGFESLFHKNSVIIHPFFPKPISPKTALDVMNSTVSGTSKYRGQHILQGDGSGNNDFVEMRFEETGEEANYSPAYFGQMVIRAAVVEHKFKSMIVEGYELLHKFPNRKFPFERINFGSISSKDVCLKICEFWGNNQMKEFNSLFSEDALIMHPLFKEPITPNIAADVLNSAMSGVSVVNELKVITGDGTGFNDVVNLYAYESGTQGNIAPDLSGIMHITLKIQNHSIQELYVHGYIVVPNVILDKSFISLPASCNSELDELNVIDSYQQEEKVAIEE